MESFAFDGGLMFWTLVTFLCLVALLARVAFRPLRRSLDERDRQIRRSLDDAAKANAQAEDILRRNEKQLGEAREETRRIINEGHRVVADMKREAEQRAKNEAALIVSQARGEIDREVQRGMDDLKQTVSNLSLRIARQVIRSELDEAKHEQLADDFVERLKKSHASRRS